MTDFNLDGVNALLGQLNAQSSALNDRVVNALGGVASWPESGVTSPGDMYAIWARVWKAEASAAKDIVDALSQTLQVLAQLLGQVDQEASDAFGGS